MQEPFLAIGIDMKAITCSLLAVFLCSTSIAGPHQYECQIESTMHLEDDGMLKLDDVWNDITFSVERSTGEIQGEFANKDWPEKRVIDKGTDLSAYKLIWVSYGVTGNESASKTGYLEVHEWVDSAFKPFVIVFAMYVITGVCA